MSSSSTTTRGFTARNESASQSRHGGARGGESRGERAATRNGQRRLVIAWVGSMAVTVPVQARVPGDLSGLARPLGEMLASSGSWADSFVAVPVWVLCLLWALILTAVGAVLLLIVNRRRKLEVQNPTITKADILGLRWRWNYQDGAICDLQSHCPKCDRPVSPRSEKRHGFLQLISFQCECRKWQSKSYQCSHEQLVERVCGAIQEQNANRSGALPRGRCAAG
jgi:hypothetical protein